MHSLAVQCIAKLCIWPCAVVAVLCLNARLLFAGSSETPATKGDTRLEFAYDYLGRRFEKKVYESSVLVKHQKFVYDGFKQIAEYDALDSNALANTYLWQPVGLDVPLLRNGSEFCVSDANKNIVALLDVNGSVTDTYIYAPFGNCAHTGSPTPPFRFSSEYYDEETGLVYYNYRYYSPALGRWLSRDPSEERYGGLSLYGICHNSCVNVSDNLGLWWFWTHKELTDDSLTKFWLALSLYNKHMSAEKAQALALKIIRMIWWTNIQTDFGSKGSEQQYHYCTHFQERKVKDFKKQYQDTLVDEKKEWDKAIVTNAYPTEGNCQEALEHLGTLTHMWQDYYGHGVEYDPYLHPEDSPRRNFSIGKITGSPDNPTMDPVTFGGLGFLGKHGGLFSILNPFSKVEPGDRAGEAFRTERFQQARLFTMQKIVEMMPVWIEKCHCLIHDWAK